MSTGRRTLWIMPGAHKTGTTTAQNIFQANTDKLSALGINYIDREAFYQSKLRQFLQQDIYYPGGSVTPASAQQSLKELTDYNSASHHTAILFVENLFGEPLYGMWSKPRPTPCLYPGFELGLNKLVEVAAPLYRLNSIYLIRRQDTFLSSLYAEFINNGWDVSVQQYLLILIGCDLSWKRIINALLSNPHIEKTFVVPFELVKGGKAVFTQELLNYIRPDANLCGWNMAVYENKSLHRDAIRLALSAFPLLKPSARHEFVNILRKFATEFTEEARFEVFDAATIGELISRFSSENVELLRLSGGKYTEIEEFYRGK